MEPTLHPEQGELGGGVRGGGVRGGRVRGGGVRGGGVRGGGRTGGVAYKYMCNIHVHVHMFINPRMHACRGLL